MKYKNTKVASKKQEKRIADELNAKVTIASGALDFQKADVRNSTFLIEAKTTEKDYYSLHAKTWLKIEEEALNDGMRIPLMCIDVLDGDYALAVLSENDFIMLFKANPCIYENYKFKQLETFHGKTSKRLKPLKDIHVELDSDMITVGFQRLLFDGVDTLIILDWTDFTLMNELL